MRRVDALGELAGLDWSVFDREPDPLASPSAAEGIRLGDELRRQVALVQPEWPSPRDRLADRRAHLRVIDLLERVPPRRG